MFFKVVSNKWASNPNYLTFLMNPATHLTFFFTHSLWFVVLAFFPFLLFETLDYSYTCIVSTSILFSTIIIVSFNALRSASQIHVRARIDASQWREQNHYLPLPLETTPRRLWYRTPIVTVHLQWRQRNYPGSLQIHHSSEWLTRSLHRPWAAST